MFIDMSANGFSKTEVVFFEECDEKLIRIENRFFRAVFAPGQAIFPVTYHYKPTGNDMLIRRETLCDSFRIGDGIQLCLPWVGDSSRRLPSKGLLRRSEWRTERIENDEEQGFSGETDISYCDPVTQIPAKLKTFVAVKAHGDSPSLTMDVRILNDGDRSARFMCAAHGRMAPGGEYRAGLYTHLPAERCWVGEFYWPVLKELGVKAHQWVDWPLNGVSEYSPDTGPQMQEYVYVFVPAPWMAYGNENSGEVIFFSGGPVRVGEKIRGTPYFCLLRRSGDLLAEMSLTRQIDVQYWGERDAVMELAPGEQADFSWTFVSTHGLARDEVMQVKKVELQGIWLKCPDGTLRWRAFTAEL